MTRGLKSPPAEGVGRFRSLFEQLASDRFAGEPEWLRALRGEAMDRFDALGLPSTKDEDWRYTNLAAVAKRRFELPDDAAGASPPDLDPGPVDGPRWVFRDGRPSSAPTVPSGLQVRHLPRDAQDPADVRIGRPADANALVALNTALFDEGILLRVGEESRLSEPLSIVFTTGSSARPVLRNPRLGIVLEPSSHAVLVELFLGTGPSWTNAVAEIACGPDSRLEHYKIQVESDDAVHTSATHVRLDRGARLRSHLVSLGDALFRDELHVTLAAEGAECELSGLYVVDGKRHAECKTVVDHAAPHGTSRQRIRGICAGESRGVFQGLVVAREGARGTDASQRNDNLLLSREAHADTKPQLEILNNDVLCFHGATVGRVDDDAVFYLRSRGVGEGAARALLTQAFAKEITGRIEIDSLREHVESRLAERIRAMCEFDGRA